MDYNQGMKGIPSKSLNHRPHSIIDKISVYFLNLHFLNLLLKQNAWAYLHSWYWGISIFIFWICFWNKEEQKVEEKPKPNFNLHFLNLLLKQRTWGRNIFQYCYHISIFLFWICFWNQSTSRGAIHSHSDLEKIQERNLFRGSDFSSIRWGNWCPGGKYRHNYERNWEFTRVYSTLRTPIKTKRQ